MAMDKEKKMFETFDSAGGPIQKNDKDSDHRDSSEGLSHTKTSPEDLQKEEN